MTGTAETEEVKDKGKRVFRKVKTFWQTASHNFFGNESMAKFLKKLFFVDRIERKNLDERCCKNIVKPYADLVKECYVSNPKWKAKTNTKDKKKNKGKIQDNVVEQLIAPTRPKNSPMFSKYEL